MKLVIVAWTVGMLIALNMVSASSHHLCDTEERQGDFGTGSLISNCECYRMLHRIMVRAEAEGDYDLALEALIGIEARVSTVQGYRFCPDDGVPE